MCHKDLVVIIIIIIIIIIKEGFGWYDIDNDIDNDVVLSAAFHTYIVAVPSNPLVSCLIIDE